MKDFLFPYKISFQDREKLTRKLVLKNCLLTCISIFFFMIAGNTIGGLQSTINKDGNLGVVSSCVVLGSYGLSAVLIPDILINLIGIKWTYTLSFALELVYIALNAYPKWYTYIPAAALTSLGQCLSFTCSSQLIVNISKSYSDITESDLAGIQAKFFSIFGIAVQSANLIGSLIIGLVFQQSKDTAFLNKTKIFDYTQCGKKFCPNSPLPSSAEPPIERIYILVGVLEICIFLAIMSSLLINDFINEDNRPKIVQIVKKGVKEYKKQLCQITQLLVIPFNLLSCFTLTFIWTDFSRSFAACSVGIDFIGWSTLVLYATASIFSPIFGKLVAKFTLIPVFVFYWLLIIGTYVWMLFWESNPETKYRLFILAILLGVIESMNTPMPRALYAVLFNTEAIYSVFSFFTGFGFLIGTLITLFACTFIKIYIILGTCVLSFICGIGLYLIQHRKGIFEIK